MAAERQVDDIEVMLRGEGAQIMVVTVELRNKE